MTCGGGPNSFQGISSRNGDFYATSDPPYATADNNVSRLVIADASAPYQNNLVLVLWDGHTGAPRRPFIPSWSPNDQTIAFIDGAASTISGGDIWTQPASGASPSKRIVAVGAKGTSTWAYKGIVWSPDSKYLVVLKTEYRSGSLYSFWLTRVSVSDGKAQDLVRLPIFPGGPYQAPVRWVADN